MVYSGGGTEQCQNPGASNKRVEHNAQSRDASLAWLLLEQVLFFISLHLDTSPARNRSIGC